MPDGGATAGFDLSVVIPVYRSADCLDALVQQVMAALNPLNCRFEIIMVNDSQPDATWQTLKDIQSRCPALRAVTFRKNFGQNNAIMAGLRLSRGRIVIIMDDDLQHDPKDIPALVASIEAGADVCFARFSTQQHAWWKRMGSWFADRVANVVLEKPKHVYMSPYKALSRAIVSEIIEFDGPHPFIDGLIFRVTHKASQVSTAHHKRYAGGGHYGLVRSISVWLRLLTSFSLTPLRTVFYAGIGFAGLGLLMAVYFSIHKILRPDVPLGWASTIVVVLVLGGVQLGCLGLMGEYLGRVFLHLNHQPQYVVETIVENTE